MNRIIEFLSVLVVAITIIGCATSDQPVFKTVNLSPEVLYPGTSSLITVIVEDRYKVVNRIEGFVKEDPDTALMLNDKGENGDVEAGDRTWSLAVPVSRQAVPGDFEVELTAYNSKGEAVVIRDKKGDMTTLMTTLNVSISPPQN